MTGRVVAGSLAGGDAEISLRRGSSIATQLLPVASESGYLHMSMSMHEHILCVCVNKSI